MLLPLSTDSGPTQRKASTRAIVCGSCVVDLTCLGVNLHEPLGGNQTHAIPPIEPTGGGITCNTGISLQRLGVPTEILTYVGPDAWGDFLRDLFHKEGLGTRHIHTHPHDPNTAVVVLVDDQGERSFLVPSRRTASKSIDHTFIRRHWPAISAASLFVLGYYGRMPALEPDLAELLRDIRATGCRTVMDSASEGGDPHRLTEVLPHLDVYVPSEHEARRQTGESDPHRMVAWFRRYNPHGLLGVKLGSRGALLEHPSEGAYLLPALDPGAPVLDTTGAGDCFLAGLLAAREEGASLAEAGRWACAAGACAVTRRGGYAGLTDRRQLLRMLQSQS